MEKYNNNIEELKKYAEMIYEQNKYMNISGFKTIEEIFDNGIISSLICLETYFNETNKEWINKKILDIGAGAGFPSIPFLLVNKNFELTILESQNKRCIFLNSIKEAFGLNNLTIINSRAEDYIKETNSFDFITARALSSIKNIYMMSHHLLKLNGYWILPKGKKYKEELEEFYSKFYNHNSEVFTYNYIYSNEQSYIIEIQKKQETNKKWPLQWKDIQKY